MVKRLLTIILIYCYSLGKSQCPQIIDYLGNPSSTPQFINCIAGDYSINFQATSSFGSYTINWGDGTANTTGASYVANSIIPHTYSNTIGTFTLTLTIPSASCTRTALVVMERPVSASIQIPLGGVTQACAPKTLTFTNSSTNVSSTTTFTWDFGDGSPVVTYDASNLGQNVTHAYLKNTVSCQTQVTLRALNYCRFNNPSAAVYNPIQIYDVDVAAITPDSPIHCMPDNLFTFTNSTNRNCVPEGNTFQRQEKWNLGDYWGYGHDSIINWRPWPPTTPVSVAFPAVVGTYTVLLLDSNLCGVTSVVLPVSIVNAPVAGVIIPPGNLCQNTTLTFTNTSSAGYSYRWDFGDGGGLQNLGSGNKTHAYATPGTYTVRVVAMLGAVGGACSNTVSVPVTILGSPTANFSLTPATGCTSLTNVTFTEFSTGASSYTWTFGNSNTSNLQTPPPQNYSITGTFIASLVVTGTTSCVNTKTASVIVRPKPVPNFPSFTPCVAAATTFSNTSTVTGTAAITNYTWDFGDGAATSTATTPVHTYTAPAVYSVQLTAATAFCSDAITKTISVNVKPTADFAFTPTINCPPFPVTFTNNSSNATNYLWRFGTAATATSIATAPSFTYTNGTQNVQNYTITLISSTGLGCADSIKKAISVRPKPVAVFNSTTTGGCSPLASTFSNSSTGAATYLWDFGDAGTSTVTSPAHTYTNISVLLQTNTVTLIATNSVSCTDTVKHTIQIYPQPLTTFTMNPGSGCTPLTINFPSVPGIVSYTWNFGDNSAPIIAASPTLHVFTNTTVANKTYTVKLVASNAFGCVDSSFKYPIIFPTPVPNFVPSLTVGCSPFSATLNNTSSLANSYRWRFGDGTPTVTTNDAAHTYSNSSATTNTTFVTTLTAYSSNGCSDSIKKNIQVYYKPHAAFTQNDPQCLSTIFNFTNSSTGVATYSWNFGDASAASTATNPTHTYTNNTINNITYTTQLIATSPNACSDIAFGYPVVYAYPVPVFTLAPLTGCSPLSNTMTNGSLYAHTYRWRFGDNVTTTVSTTNATHIYTNTSSTANQTFTCTLTAFNNNGCRDSSKQSVTVFYKPHAAFIQNAPLCESKVISFTNTTSGAATSTWDFGDLSALSNATSPTHTYVNNTISNINYTVHLLMTTANSCTDEAYGYPEIYAYPVVNFTLAPTTGCSPLSTTLTNGSSYAHTFRWRFGDNVTTTVSTTDATHTYSNTSYTTNQTFTCTLTAFNNNGCRDSVKKGVLVYYKPHAAFLQSTPGCASKVVSFTNTTDGVAASSWNFGDLSPLSTTTSPTHTYVNNTISNLNFTVHLLMTTANSCTDEAFGYPEIFAHPIVDYIVTPTVGCSPLSTTLTNSSNFAHTYLWRYGDGGTATSTNTSHTYTNTSNTTNQTFTNTLIAFNNNGCKDSIKKSVLVFYKPKALFTETDPKCLSQTITFSNSSLGAATNTWTFGDGSPVSTALHPSHTYTNTAINNTNYTVQLVVTTSSLCRDTAYGYPEIYAKPIVLFAATPTVGCSPMIATMTNSSTAAHTYKWKFGDNATSTLQATSHTYSNASNSTNQNYTCTLVSYNNNGCRDSMAVPLLVYYKPRSVFSLDTPACTPKLITFTNSSIGAVSYNWNLGDGGTATSSNTSHQYVNTTPFNQTYTVSLISIMSNNCKDTLNVPMTVHPRPHFSISMLPDSGCTPLSVFFRKMVGVTHYKWSDNDSPFGPDGGDFSSLFNNYENTTVTHTIKLIAHDVYNCVDTPKTTIRVFPKPKAIFSASPLNIYIPNQATQMSNASIGAATYTWSFGDGASSNEVQPSHFYTTPGEFPIILMASSNKGCMDTTELDQRVVALAETTVEMPNAFTPNPAGSLGNTFSNESDRKNEIFHPNVRGADKYELTIYSRWGELLFATKDPLQGWDGYYKGQICTQDVYIWKIAATFVDGKVYNKTGDFLLLR